MSRRAAVGIHRPAIAHADRAIGALDLDAPGWVHWWVSPDVARHDPHDERWWQDYVGTVEAAARTAALGNLCAYPLRYITD